MVAEKKVILSFGEGTSGVEVRVQCTDPFISRETAMQLCKSVRDKAFERGFVVWMYYMKPHHLVRLAWPRGGPPEPKNINALRKKILSVGVKSYKGDVP